MEERFEEFWKAFPRKIGKLGAERKYAAVIKQKRATHEQIMEGLHRFVDFHKAKGTEQQYIKHPMTWLNQGCWEDDLGAISMPCERLPNGPPSYLRQRQPEHHETPESKARKKLKLEVHEVMRRRQIDPFLMYAERPEDYQAMFQEIAATIQPRERA